MPRMVSPMSDIPIRLYAALLGSLDSYGARPDRPVPPRVSIQALRSVLQCVGALKTSAALPACHFGRHLCAATGSCQSAGEAQSGSCPTGAWWWRLRRRQFRFLRRRPPRTEWRLCPRLAGLGAGNQVSVASGRNR